MEPNRIYQGKNGDMLITCSTIIENAIANQSVLIEKRPIWADPFFTKLQERINNAFSNIIGVSSAEMMKRATRQVTTIQQKALKDIIDLHVQLEVDYEDDKERLKIVLDTLGMTTLYKEAQNKSQESLIKLLYQFKTNLTEELKAEITAKGTPLKLLDDIVDYADAMKQANVSQEQAKGIRKEISQEGQDELNAIYKQVIGVAKIARRFFIDNKAKKGLFSYSKILNQLSSSPLKVSNGNESTD